MEMSNIIGFVVSLALLYFGIKVAFKLFKWIGIFLIVVFVLKIAGIL